VIVATAGHIDHGKTTLVKALTGVDTDRLPQEKARGISIDLGFAYWKAPAGGIVGFVDVPGHERFVRNMLAGVCGIDQAMLVVAADDGVMPQTREHLHILDLLDIRAGMVVITKADRVGGERLEQVQREVRALLAGTSLAGADLLAVSAVTGQGLDALRERLADAAVHCRREHAVGRRLRYAVDRSFVVAGSGTVVTGTVFDGIVRVGDRLLVSPAGLQARVRGIQKDGVKAEFAEAGERCALNLAGVDVAQVQRGDWVVHPDLHAPASRIDVELRVLAGEAQALRHWTPVHLHIGTREVTARVSLRRGAAIEPGQRAFARLVADRPIVAAHGDRFIVRDQSAWRTVGGGVVLDANPSHRRLPSQAWARQLRALGAPSVAQALGELVACTPAGVNAQAFSRNFKLTPQTLTRLLADAGLAMVGSGAQAVVLTGEQAQARMARRVQVAEVENPQHTRLWQLAVAPLRAAGRAGTTVGALAQTTGAKEQVLRDMLHRQARSGEAVRVTDERFYLRETIDDFIAVAGRVALAAPGRRFTAAEFRDAAGIGRNLAVQVLEAIDRLGATQRVGDARVVRTALAPSPPPQGETRP